MQIIIFIPQNTTNNNIYTTNNNILDINALKYNTNINICTTKK